MLDIFNFIILYVNYFWIKLEKKNTCSQQKLLIIVKINYTMKILEYSIVTRASKTAVWKAFLHHKEKKQNEHIYKASQTVHHKQPRLVADLASGLMMWIYSFILLKRKTEKSVCHKINKSRVKNRFPQTNSGW